MVPLYLGSDGSLRRNSWVARLLGGGIAPVERLSLRVVTQVRNAFSMHISKGCPST